jgi:uncharacterized delta-60 repeat protein
MRLLRLLVAGLALLPFLHCPAAGQALDPSFNSVTSLYASGEIYSLGTQQADGKRVVAGTFTRINGTPVSRLVRVDAAGALDLPFVQNVGTASNVYRVKSLLAGQYLLASSGGTVTAGGISRTELLRLNADGTADATFDVGTGPTAANVYAASTDFAVQPDGKIVVAGYFDNFNNVPAPGLVRLNANGSVDAAFSAGTGGAGGTANYYPTAVAIQPDGKILVGGSFTSFNGHPTNGVARLNANGTVDATFTAPLQPNAEVEGLVLQPNGNVLVNGYRVLATSNALLSLARLLPSGALDPGFATTTLYSITSGGYEPAVVLQPDGKLLVTGNFSNTVARLNADGTLDASFQATVPLSPVTIGLQPNGSVLMGFDLFSGLEKTLTSLTSTGAPNPAFAPTVQSPGTVGALVRQPDGKLLLGGNFTELNGQPVHRLVRLTANGAVDAGFTASTGVVRGVVTCLLLQPDGKVLAGTAQGLNRFETTGTPDATFAASSAAYGATSLAIQPDGKLLVGVLYTGSVGGVGFNRLVRLTSTGTFDPTFVRANTATTPTGTIGITDAVLVQPDGRILVGGIFQASGQAAVGRVVRYETTGALDPTFNNTLAFTAANGASSSANRIYSLAFQPDGKLLVGGNFGAISGTQHYGVARLVANGTPDASFASTAVLTGPVYSVAQQPNGRVLLGGNFTNAGTAGTVNNLARVLDNGSTDASFTNAAAPNGTVRTVVVQPDGAIVLAGNFTAVGGQPNVDIARITASNVLAVAAPASVAAHTTAWPVPAHGQLHIAPDQTAHPLTLELLDAVGRPLRQQPATSAAEQTLNLDALPAGVYLLRVQYTAGTVTRRIAVQ